VARAAETAREGQAPRAGLVVSARGNPVGDGRSAVREVHVASVLEYVAARLRAWEVDRVFGFPGRDVDSLVAALTGDGEHPEFVQTRHEESAALMACAHAKLTGRIGCCLAPSGIGALRLLGGLYDAALDRVPVLALVGQEPPPNDGGKRHDSGKRRRTTAGPDLFAGVSDYCEPVFDPARMGDALDRALGAALSDRGVATLIVPRTVLTAQAPPASRAGKAAFAPLLRRPAPRSPEKRDVLRAADVLNAGRKVAVVVGPGAAGASGQVVALAELLGAAVVKTPSARDIVPDDLPYVAGVVTHRGSTVAAALLRDCDTLLLIGADGADDFDTAWAPATGRSRVAVVGTDEDVAMADGDEVADARVTADAGVTLDALLPLLRRRTNRRWRAHVRRAVRDWRAEGRSKAHRFFGMAINPRSVVAELSARLPDRAVVVTDTGSALDWWTRHLELRDGMRSARSGHLATPGAAVPYALAARLALPDRPVIALIGDGALQAGGMNELITVRRHLERLADLPPTIFCVLNNEDLSRLTWERRTAAHNPRIPVTGEVPALSYERYAGLLGLPGVCCDRPGSVAAVWEDALAAQGPMLLEFMVDGDTPPDWAEPTGAGPRTAAGARSPFAA
jgi:pyruvate dehydrogenase (quinone)